MKKIAIGMISLSLLGMMFTTSCGKSSGKKQIGILQVATHDALDLCREGFVSALKDGGFVDGENVTITTQNPEGDSTKQVSAAKSLVLNSDLVFGISTGSAQALKSAAVDFEKDIPILFSASTDPVGSNITTSSEYENITGTSDAGDTKKNVSLFTYFSNVDKVACLYNSAEQNSQIQKEECKSACADYNLSFEDAGITSANQINSAFQGLVSKGVDGVFIPTDNMVAENISLLKDIAVENKIILVCADTSLVANGGSLGFGVDYKGLGEQTGKMAIDILNETKKAKDIAWEKTASFSIAINDEFFTNTGITVPDEIKKMMLVG